MLLHAPRQKPEPWPNRRSAVSHGWLVPLAAIEYEFEWLAFLLSRWSFLEVLEYLGSFSILVAVIFYFSESGDRMKQKHYQAWQVINTAQNKGGSGGRIEALQELNLDGVQLVGVDVSGAFLQGVHLPRARLIRANLTAVDARNSDFQSADLLFANLSSGNFRESNFSNTSLEGADLSKVDFCSANLSHANLDGAVLDTAELGKTDLQNVRWQKIKSLQGADVRQVRNPPDGFLRWAAAHGATVDGSANSDCE